MTFREIQDAVIEQRFNTALRPRVKRWVNARYMAIWNAGDWTFRRVTAQSLPVTGGDTTPAMPSDFQESVHLFDDQGNEITYQEAHLFRPAFAYRTDTGRSEAFTVANKQIILGPTPDQAYTYSLDYRRRVSKVDPNGSVVPGILSDDLDQPIWPAEHDELLIVDTLMYGMQLGNDDTWTGLKDGRDEMFSAFEDAMLADPGGTTREYGSDHLR